MEPVEFYAHDKEGKYLRVINYKIEPGEDYMEFVKRTANKLFAISKAYYKFWVYTTRKVYVDPDNLMITIDREGNMRKEPWSKE